MNNTFIKNAIALIVIATCVLGVVLVPLTFISSMSATSLGDVAAAAGASASGSFPTSASMAHMRTGSGLVGGLIILAVVTCMAMGKASGTSHRRYDTEL